MKIKVKQKLNMHVMELNNNKYMTNELTKKKLRNSGAFFGH